MPSKPARPVRSAKPSDARLTVERLGDRVVPAVLNPQAETLPAAVVGTPLATDLTVARFDSSDPAAGLTATVAINGGAAVTATVTQTGTGDDGVPEYAVRLPAGAYTPSAAGAGALGFVVTIRDAADNTTARVSGRADVQTSPLVIVSTNETIAPTEGASGTFPLAVFRVADAASTAEDYTVTVDWGDGTTPSSGTVTALGEGRFQVEGAHAYAAPDEYEIAVTITDDEGHTLVAQAETMPVVNAATSALVVPPLATTVGVPLDDVRIATFTDANLLAVAGDYTATVNWGVGGPVAATVISTGVDTNGAHFAVVADHTYSFTLPAGATLTVEVENSDSESTLTATGAVTVSDLSILPVPPDARQYVRNLYLRELGRFGTDSEIDVWVSAMGGPNGRTAVANAISRSQEARTRTVEGWYETFLNRTVRDGEANGWVNALLNGQTEEQVLGGILGSGEFGARAQSLVTNGSAEERQVKAMYTLLLGRTASGAEVTTWANSLPQIGASGVANGFLTSVEYRTRVFEGYYVSILHRQADAPGLHGWVHSGLESVTVRAAIEAAA
jgi:hypothetical protein